MKRLALDLAPGATLTIVGAMLRGAVVADGFALVRQARD